MRPLRCRIAARISFSSASGSTRGARRTEHEVEDALVERLLRPRREAPRAARATKPGLKPQIQNRSAKPKPKPRSSSRSSRAAREDQRQHHRDEQHEVDDQRDDDRDLEEEGEAGPQRGAHGRQPLAPGERAAPLERRIELVDQLAALGGAEVAAILLEQHGQRLLGLGLGQARHRHRVGPGELAAATAQRFEQDALAPWARRSPFFQWSDIPWVLPGSAVSAISVSIDCLMIGRRATSARPGRHGAVVALLARLHAQRQAVLRRRKRARRKLRERARRVERAVEVDDDAPRRRIRQRRVEKAARGIGEIAVGLVAEQDEESLAIVVHQAVEAKRPARDVEHDLSRRARQHRTDVVGNADQPLLGERLESAGHHPFAARGKPLGPGKVMAAPGSPDRARARRRSSPRRISSYDIASVRDAIRTAGVGVGAQHLLADRRAVAGHGHARARPTASPAPSSSSVAVPIGSAFGPGSSG